jgi:hypothetical protein
LRIEQPTQLRPPAPGIPASFSEAASIGRCRI